jgi:hypothetical protein
MNSSHLNENFWENISPKKIHSNQKKFDKEN